MGIFNSFFWWWNIKFDGFNDKCGYGIQMVGLIVVLRGNGGSFVGVVYNCNLYFIRGIGDVVVNGFKEKIGVKNVFVKVGN